MPKKQLKVGLVSLKQSKEGKWVVRWWDARLQKYFRRVLPATSYQEAVTMARVYNMELASERGFVPSVRAKAGHGVNEAITEMIGNSDANDRTKADYASRANQFLTWLRDLRPGVTKWAQVNAKALQDYLRHCEGLGLRHDSIRLRYHVLRSTSLYMANTYPDRYSHVASAVKLKRDKTAGGSQGERSVLSAAQMLDLLAYAEKIRPDIYPIMVLQGLAGLRISEGANLREEDVNFDQGSITVAATSHHTPKTRSSYRTVPVTHCVMEVLKTTISGLEVRHSEGFLFLTKHGEPWSVDGLSHAMARIVKGAWRETGHEILRGFMSRELRATFINLVRDQRADHRVLQRYIGHSSGDVLGEHYEKATIERMRQEIVLRVEAGLADGQGSEEVGESGERMASDLH